MTPRFATLIAALAVLCSGCPSQEVIISISGSLYGCDDLDACGGLEGATVRLLDLEETTHAQVNTDARGDFTLEEVPGNSVVFLVAELWPDHVPVAFLGQTGSVDGSLEDGSFYSAPLADAQAMIDAFSAAHPDQTTVQTIDPDSDGNGGMIRGQFKTAVSGILPEDWPGRDRLTCQFENADGDIFPCVYRDQYGEPDWSFETTSLHGGFAAFGLPAGLYTGVVFDGREDEAEQYALFHAYVVEDGVTIFDVFTSPF